MHDAGVAKMADTDRPVHVARLQVRKDAAEAALDRAADCDVFGSFTPGEAISQGAH